MTMLDATTEASNRNAQDLALTKYKDHMCYVLNGTGNGSRVPFLKTMTLQCHHDQALSGALLEFHLTDSLYSTNLYLYRYVRIIFDEELEPKIVQRRAITAPELMTYFEVYVKMFQTENKSFPKVIFLCLLLLRITCKIRIS